MTATYCNINDTDYPSTRQNIINNITNTLTDRRAANHAAIQLVNGTWGKTLNELNCHLHPLDSLATSTKKAMKKVEKDHGLSGTLHGSECIAGNIVFCLSKMRYKDGKGDPKGFKAFLDRQGLKRSLILRNRGNCLHLLFHTAGIIVQHHEHFMTYLEQGSAVPRLRQCLLTDLKTTQARVELQVLGLLGKLLTGPWMTQFYASPLTQVQHIEGISIVKGIVNKLKKQRSTPLNLLTSTHDFFGKMLHEKEIYATLLTRMKPTRRCAHVCYIDGSLLADCC